MKRTLLLLITLLTSIVVFSQKVNTLEINDICDAPKKTYGNIEAVNEFKDSLKATIQIYKITLGTKTEDLDETFIERIKNESTIYKLNNKMAISVSVGRIEENGDKFYIYKIHLFRKNKGCWEDTTRDTQWTKFNLGNFTSGYGYGFEGTKEFVRFSGNLSIE